MDSTLGWLKHGLIYFAATFGYRRPIFNLAKRAAKITGKPLLNAGCKYTYTELSDVNLDIGIRKVPNFVNGDIQGLSMLTTSSLALCMLVMYLSTLKTLTQLCRSSTGWLKMFLLSLHFHCRRPHGFGLTTNGFFGRVRDLFEHHIL